MRLFVVVLMASFVLMGCDENRIYERNVDFSERHWAVSNRPEFEFDVNDTGYRYNIYCNIRNAVSYPYSRLFLHYELIDSSGKSLEKKLVSANLFDQKTGEPYGESGIGDIYDQRIPLLSNYTFATAGKYKVRLEQYMRTDTLQGVLAVGVRVEKQ